MKAVKVAVLAAPCNVLAAPHIHSMLAIPHSVLTTPRGLPAALCDVLSLKVNGNSRGPEGPSGGGHIHENFYGLVLLKNHFYTQKKR